MSRYQFDPFDQSEMYVARWQKEMHKAELRRAAQAARTRKQTHGTGTPISEVWLHVRVAIAAIRRQLESRRRA